MCEYARNIKVYDFTVMESGEIRELRTTEGLFQDAPDHSTFEELEDMAQSRRFWRSLVVAIEPEDTLELQKRKKARKTRSSGTTTLDLDASQWLKGVNKPGKFDGGLIAKEQKQLRRADDCVATTLYGFNSLRV